jgi:ABC-type multidrug transport system permease subunit
VIAGMALLVAFAFAFSWLWTMLGMLMRDEKAVMNASFLLFPVTFLSNVFVQPMTMPGGLQAVVKDQPGHPSCGHGARPDDQPQRSTATSSGRSRGAWPSS